MRVCGNVEHVVPVCFVCRILCLFHVVARMLSLEDDLEQTKISSERAEKALMAAHQEVGLSTKNRIACVVSLGRKRTAGGQVFVFAVLANY